MSSGLPGRVIRVVSVPPHEQIYVAWDVDRVTIPPEINPDALPPEEYR